MSISLRPLSSLPRRFRNAAVLTALFLGCVVFVGNQNTNTLDPYLEKVPYGPQLQEGVHHVVQGAQQVVDHIPNPLSAPAHSRPPDQAHSRSGETRWHSDWKWRNPFSNSVTLDQERSLLPPLPDRPPIYTYYDIGQRRKNEKSRKAEQDLLHIWRRAWWAQGFKPVVLRKSEAVKNSLYRRFQHLELEPSFENELMRWLAWGNMGTGIMSNFLALPMAGRDDSLLSFLRRGEYPTLTRFEDLGNGLYFGSRDAIDAVLKEAASCPALHRVKSIEEAIPADKIHTEKKSASIAYYSESAIKQKYPLIKDKLENPDTVGDGLAILSTLINSHLHQTWQNLSPKGVAVLKPIPEHTTSIIASAMDIAANLTECPATPLPSSCPPNMHKCKACVGNQLRISTPKTFLNDSELFTIVTMPHPYTIQSLLNSKDGLDLRFIRRETDRDIWITAVTNVLLGNEPSPFARLSAVKEAIASEHGSARSLWLTAETALSKEREKDLEDLEWVFGFRLPREPFTSGKSETPGSGSERQPNPEYGDRPVPSQADLETEKALAEKANLFLRKPSRTQEQIEAWNLADTEIYKFIRATNVRRTAERLRWQAEESSSLGKGVFDRWKDNII